MDPPVNAIASAQLRDANLWSTDQVPVSSDHWDNIKTQLDLVLLAIEALMDIGSDAMIQAATEVGLKDALGDRVMLWRLRQSNPIRKGSGGRKKLDIEEARALVLVSCHLAKQNHDTIRRAVSILEDFAEQDRPFHQNALLGDYLDRFTNFYQERMDSENVTTDHLTHLGLKLLIDLLFYGDAQGVRRFWMALIDRTHG
jgi:hypothetical protein